MEMGDVSCILNRKSDRIVGKGQEWDDNYNCYHTWVQSGENIEHCSLINLQFIKIMIFLIPE